MDETIGARGGHNDRLRSLKISKAKKKKLQDYEEEYIKQLEKKVKKQQRYTLIKTIPIVVTGTFIQNIFGIKEEKEDSNQKQKESRKREKQELKEKKIITLPNGGEVIVYIPKKEKKAEKEEIRIELPEEDKTKEKQTQPNEITETSNRKHEPLTSPALEPTFLFIPTPTKEKEKPIISDKLLEEIEKDIKFRDVDFNNLDDDAKDRLSKLRSRRIVDYYEDRLKEIRYDLRKIIYDYNVIVYDEEGIVLSKEEELLLDRLTELISRIEDLKRKLDIEDIDRYDDNYIYVLIEEYINDFRSKKVVEEIKDSPLYILISEKLDELEKQRESYSKKVEIKQDELAEKEEDFEDLKKRYTSIERINRDLRDIQLEQERMLANLREKVANSVTEFERITYEMKTMDLARTKMLRLLMFQMFLPGPKYAKTFALSAAAYLQFLKLISEPKCDEKKLHVIQVEDYSRDIENSISAIDDASKLLGNTSSQVDRMLKEITTKYGDYIGVVPECDRIISSLKRIKNDIEEKEEEMKRLRKEQEKVLENNNAKVLKKGTYPVN